MYFHLHCIDFWKGSIPRPIWTESMSMQTTFTVYMSTWQWTYDAFLLGHVTLSWPYSIQDKKKCVKWANKHRTSRLWSHRVNRCEAVLCFWGFAFCFKQTQRSFWMSLSMTAGMTNESITQWCLVYAQCKGQRSYCLSHHLYWFVASHWEMTKKQYSVTCPVNINAEDVAGTRPEIKCLATQRPMAY